MFSSFSKVKGSIFLGRFLTISRLEVRTESKNRPTLLCMHVWFRNSNNKGSKLTKRNPLFFFLYMYVQGGK
jgi:hypothetical protein